MRLDIICTILRIGFNLLIVGAASMGPGAHSNAVIFDPNGPGMGLDLDFNIFDVDDIDSDAINFDHDVANFSYNNTDFKFNNIDLGDLDIDIGMNYSTNNANFNIGDMLTTKEAEPVALLQLPNEKPEELTVSRVNNTGSSMHQEPVRSSEMQVQKRKKAEEVNEGDILPEGSRRNRNKTARALGLDS